jgi:hypothetical protein
MRERLKMSEESVAVIEKEAPKARKPRAKKAAEESTVIESVSIEEAKETKTDEGQTVITGPKRARAPRQSNMHTKEDGIVGSHAADSALKRKVAPVEKEDKREKIALWSSKNVRWTGIGELSKGYNIVTKEAAEKWLAKEGIREATPEEVATYYGK